MRSKGLRRTAAAILLAAILCSLCACGVTVHTETSGTAAKELEAAVRANLQHYVDQDDAAAYDAFYPGVVGKSSFPELFRNVLGYFPIEEGYRLELQYCDPYRSEDDPMKKLVFAEYIVTFGDRVFHLSVTYAKDGEHEGFQKWQIMDEEDYAQMEQSLQ